MREIAYSRCPALIRLRDCVAHTTPPWARRGFSETVDRAAAGAVGGVSLALMPDGDIVAAWSERAGAAWRALVSVRWEERWGEPLVVVERARAGDVSLAHGAGSRLLADGADRVVESDEPPPLTLQAGDILVASSDGGLSWLECTRGEARTPTSGEATVAEADLVPCPGDARADGAGPPLRLRITGGTLEGSVDGGLTWPRRRELDADPSVTPAIVVSASGIVVAFAAGDGSIRVLGLPADTLPGHPAGERGQQQGDWRHDDRSWLELLKGAPVQPQVGAK